MTNKKQVARGEKLFSVSIKDCVLQTFQAGGPGGQHQNHSNTGVRIKHTPSGATAESREHRSQLQNKQEAWKRLVNSPKFTIWLNNEAWIRQGLPSPEESVAKTLIPENLRVEVKDERGRWSAWAEEK